MILCLETATNLCSVALCDNAGVISLKESGESKSHASMLTVFINEIFKENHIKATDLEAVAVSKGPGSYTGLRIGVSVAKGIAYASAIPLIGVETTLSMFRGIRGIYEIAESDSNTLWCPMLDARRMEVYYAIYDNGGNIIKDISAGIIHENSFMEIPESEKIIFFGDGSSKCKEIIKRTNVHFDDEFRISAAHMQIPAFQYLKNNHHEDIAYFEPFYLKDFITSKPGKNVLGQ
jgi:tRNA threonylcarbamoyladenosine biosynthesis protein TsaB